MVYSLLYRRPPFVASSQDSLDGRSRADSTESSLNEKPFSLNKGVPDALAFDRIISGGTCPPCTTRDFMNYLKYVERSAENLQFFLWYQDYSSRFDRLPNGEKSLSPAWTKADAEEVSNRPPHKSNIAITDLFKGTSLEDGKGQATDRVDPFNTPPITPSLDEKLPFDLGSNHGDEKSMSSHSIMSPGLSSQRAFDHAGMKWMPFTAQPYREEITRIITVYIADDAPRQLNLSSRERWGLLRALQKTTHPSAFQAVVSSVEYSLRRQSHPNFIRWTICNGNRSRVIFARGLGVFGIIAGSVADLLITLSHAGRAWRVLPLLLWFIGIATLIAAWKGMCVVLHGLHHRHLRPWELFEDDTESIPSDKASSRDSLTSSSSNSWEDEPWVPKYTKRNIVRKVFDREVWIQEPALRQIQDTIFLQAILGSFTLSCIAVAIFCAVPAGNLY